MSAPLIQHIADSLNCSEAEARSRLQDALAALKQQARDTDEAALADLGSFSVEDGRLTFSPEPALARQVNHRFAGLTPVSVSQSQSGAAEAGAPPAEDTTEPPSEETETPPETPADEASEEPEESTTEREDEHEKEPEAEDEWQPPEPDDSHHPLGPKEPPPFEEPEHTVLDEDEESPEPEPTPEDEFEEDDSTEDEPDEPAFTPLPTEAKPSDEDTTEPAEASVEDETAAEPEDAPSEGEPEEESLSAWPAEEETAPEEPEAAAEDAAPSGDTEDRAPRQRRPDRDRNSSAGILIGLFVIIAAVAVGGYLLQQQGVFQSNEPGDASPPTAQQDAATGEQPAPANQSATPSDTAAAASTGQDTAATDDAPADPTPGEAQTTASGIDPAAGGYTIVIASRQQRSLAENVVEQYQQELQDEGLPVEIIVGQSDGQTRYRVGVGQFSTIDAATAERDRLADRLPDGAWVLRIRPNSS